MAEVHGTYDDRFKGVADQMGINLDAGKDVGACVSVVHDGQTVVDVWAGAIDDQGTPWAEDTLINVWSSTKTMCNLSALVLADRGELDLYAPVSTYWPEFAANDKDDVATRHFLSHSAGLSGWDEPLVEDDLYDWEKCTSLLAAQAPWWEPGTASGYHAITQGYLVGEVVRRITGTTVGEFFAKEIAGPLGADFHIGTGPECDDRIALVIPPSDAALDAAAEGVEADGIPLKTLRNPALSADWSWHEAWRRAEIPAANGHGNARSVARVQSVVSHGGEIDGVRILSEEGVNRIFDKQTEGVDHVFGMPITFGMGYGINSESTPIGPNDRTCFWGGWGGSIVINDCENRLTVAYVMNRMGEGTMGDDRGLSIALAAYAAALAG